MAAENYTLTLETRTAEAGWLHSGSRILVKVAGKIEIMTITAMDRTDFDPFSLKFSSNIGTEFTLHHSDKVTEILN